MTALEPGAEPDFVPDVEQLRRLFEMNGFRVVDGDFTRLDGRRTRVCILPVDPIPLLKAAIDALEHREQTR